MYYYQSLLFVLVSAKTYKALEVLLYAYLVCVLSFAALNVTNVTYFMWIVGLGKREFQKGTAVAPSNAMWSAVSDMSCYGFLMCYIICQEIFHMLLTPIICQEIFYMLLTPTVILSGIVIVLGSR